MCSRYCTVEANYVEVSRGLFATAELLVGLGGEAITTLFSDVNVNGK